MALTQEEIQKQLEDYDFDALYEEIQSNITDKYTKGEGDDYPRSSNLNFVSYGNISLERTAITIHRYLTISLHS